MLSVVFDAVKFTNGVVGFRRRHARDKDKLQALITDLDQYVKEMDSGSQREARVSCRGSIDVKGDPFLCE